MILMTILFSLGLLAQPAPVLSDSQFAYELKFDAYWYQYLAAKAGCPGPKDPKAISEPIHKEDCNLLPTLDTDAYRKARELAKKVFGLQDASPK